MHTTTRLLIARQGRSRVSGHSNRNAHNYKTIGTTFINFHFIQSGEFVTQTISKHFDRQGDVMRDAYHQYIKENMAVMRNENPTLSGREVLQTVRTMQGAPATSETKSIQYN
jgi:hypothetical protein